MVENCKNAKEKNIHCIAQCVKLQAVKRAWNVQNKMIKEESHPHSLAQTNNGKWQKKCFKPAKGKFRAQRLLFSLL